MTWRVHLHDHESPEPRNGEGSHRQRLLEGRDFGDGVQDGQRHYAIGYAAYEVESDWSAEVVHDEVEVFDARRVDCLFEPSRQPGPGVVEVLRAVRESKTLHVERDTFETSTGQFGQHFSVEVCRRRHTVEADHCRTIALVHKRRTLGARLQMLDREVPLFYQDGFDDLANAS